MEDFGILLSREEAYEKASSLLHYARLLMQPLAKVDGGDINNMRNESANP